MARGQIIEKSKDVWLIRVQHRLANGKRKSVSKQFRGKKKDAEKFLTSWLRDMDTGTFIEPSRQTLNEHLDNWLSAVKVKVRPQTYNSYESALRVHIRPRLGDLRLASVKTTNIQKVVSEMVDNGLSPCTVKYVVSILSMALIKAVHLGSIFSNPCQFVETPKRKKSKVSVFTVKQADSFLKACQNEKHGLIYELALFSGCRPEEYLALQWDDVDFDQNTIRIRQALVWRKGGGFVFDDLKTDASRRVIPLPKKLMLKLKEHKRQQTEHRFKLGQDYENHSLVFAQDNGRPHHYRNLTQRHFEKILVKAKLDGLGFTPYSLRHSTATLLLDSKETVKTVQERLGHTTARMTLDVYAHSLPNQQENATAKLAEKLYRKTGS
jgi:integrase